jgi:hypothetical protein
MSRMKAVKARALLEDLEWEERYGLSEVIHSRVPGPATAAEHLLVTPSRTLTVDQGQDLRPAIDASHRVWELQQKFDWSAARALREEQCKVLVRGQLLGHGESRMLVVPDSQSIASNQRIAVKVETPDIAEGSVWGLLDVSGWPTRAAMSRLTGDPELLDLRMVVPDLGPLPLPVGDHGDVGYWYRVWQVNIPLILRLDLADLGLEDEQAQRSAVTALAGLALADPNVATARVGGTPMADWVNELLSLSEKRRKWRKKLKKRAAKQDQLAQADRARLEIRELPPPRLLKSAREAEEYAAEVMRSLGYSDATATGLGSDGGIDVTSSGAVAQVKMEAVPTGRPVLQAIYGISLLEGKTALVFSLAGFTTQALDWAERAKVACFEFSFDGSIIARSPAAENSLQHLTNWPSRESEQPPPQLPGPPAPAVTEFPRFGPVSDEVRTLVDIRFPENK